MAYNTKGNHRQWNRDNENIEIQFPPPKVDVAVSRQKCMDTIINKCPCCVCHSLDGISGAWWYENETAGDFKLIPISTNYAHTKESLMFPVAGQGNPPFAFPMILQMHCE